MDRNKYWKISYPYNFIDVPYDPNLVYNYKIYQGARAFKKEKTYKDFH